MKSQNSQGGAPLLMLGSSRRGCLGVAISWIILWVFLQEDERMTRVYDYEKYPYIQRRHGVQSKDNSQSLQLALKHSWPQKYEPLMPSLEGEDERVAEMEKVKDGLVACGALEAGGRVAVGAVGGLAGDGGGTHGGEERPGWQTSWRLAGKEDGVGQRDEIRGRRTRTGHSIAISAPTQTRRDGEWQ